MSVVHTDIIIIIRFIGERSEPLSRVFSDKPRDIYGGVRTYVSNTHAHVRMRMYV